MCELHLFHIVARTPVLLNTTPVHGIVAKGGQLIITDKKIGSRQEQKRSFLIKNYA